MYHRAARGPPGLRSFEYKPLDYGKASIRVLEVLPRRLGAEYTECLMRHTDLNDEYTCLSYTWGSPTLPSDIIQINGKRFLVRPNLLSFLRVARKKYPSRPLWIDALCIDQENVEERNHQVQQMGQIYARATQVISWLGKTEEDQKFLSHEEFTRPSSSINKDVLISPVPYQDIPLGLRMSFLGNEYWGRAWIIQELVLARQVILASDMKELDYNKVPKFLGRLDSRLPDQSLKGKSLIELLSIFRGRGCTTKRDRIFSLLALCTEDITVDYAITDEAVFHQTLKACHETLCICAVSVVAQALELRWSDICHLLFVEIQLRPATRDSPCCDHGGDCLPVGWRSSPEKDLLFCFSTICQDFTMHVLCVEVHSTGFYHAYLADWRSGEGAAALNMGKAFYTVIQVTRVPGEEVYNIRLDLQTLILLANWSQHCWDHITPHRATLRVLDE
ncbi:HET-domain-containing protein [Lentithecium fluviatile CBS 122367]|uniref:HET-domain-containing protein n=1 Tax=Lentithecium fluviatile CBS 122367 TaxID=1168545 RepID=A0A6G1IPB8_9PLEO|nr:HET-domain-containing protein [Lentithecium fluviatile CBS 122367]